MLSVFNAISSLAAAAELSEAERTEIVKEAIPLAEEKDRGVHEGLVFSFHIRGKEWSVVVDIGERWLKILSTEELEQSIRGAVQGN